MGASRVCSATGGVRPHGIHTGEKSRFGLWIFGVLFFVTDDQANLNFNPVNLASWRDLDVSEPITQCLLEHFYKKVASTHTALFRTKKIMSLK